MDKMINNPHLQPTTPQGLGNKVQLDIRLYFLRRGIQNMHSMTKETFKVCVDDESGKKYVKKAADELDKNHVSSSDDIVTGFMPAIPNSQLCPVSNYELYLAKLHPDCDSLWQRPLMMNSVEAQGKSVWFYKSKLGCNTLANFMSKISSTCNLSKKYTNHCLRVTGITRLARVGYTAKQIMSVSGHKSVQSLSIYHKVSGEEKIRMGQALQKYASENTSGSASLMPQDDDQQSFDPQFDLVLSQLPLDNIQAQPTQVNQCNSGLPVFNNCSIGSVVINYKS